MTDPLVSIIIPTKNRVDLLQEALRSIQQQTYGNWEVLVVDDDSTDDTLAQVMSLGKMDNRIHGFKRDRIQTGASACRNEGVIHSRGIYVIFLDSDDLLAPFCVEQRMRIMNGNPDLDFAAFCCESFRVMPGDVGMLHNVFSEEDDINRFLKRDVVWQTAGVMWRRNVVDQLGGWDEALFSWQDWEYHLRALIQGCKYKKFPLLDCYWRLPPEGGETIGLRSRSPAHLLNQEYLFSKIICLFRENGLLNNLRLNLLAGNYLHFARLWEESHQSRADSLRVWALCYQENLIGYWDYFKVKAYFLLADYRGGWRMRAYLRPKLVKWYPSLMDSQTMNCVPANEKR